MSYLDPRAGETSGDDTSVPASYGYADFRPQHLGEVPPVEKEETPEPAKRGPGRRRASGKTGKSDKSGKSRAGRNLPAAIAVGVGLILVVLGSLFVWWPAFLGLIAVAAGLGVWEMTRAIRKTGAEPPLIPLLAGTLLMIGLAYHDGPDSLLVALAVTIVAAVVWRLADGLKSIKRDFTATLMIAVYVPFLLSFAILLQQPDPAGDGRYRILCTLLAIVLSDTGGYAAGVFLGKHKMAPSISPGKTWEGFAGSICASAIGSALLLYFLLDIPSYWGLLFGAVISVVAVAGDLAESMLKRDLGIKDMSNLLPGHGGIMDRLDSIVFAVPTAYLLFALIAHQL
ncbi:phosphatidate cytidylyltransferase [Actinoplanes sp. CA-030573]|uniref:phosphatidate cytidylyltransferase n=1 Tax=Actinoplanes sp. CA-030573 TaxID=3239898 RepID=UPI003D8A51C9